MSAPGFFISLEGGEGSGKTTQINQLAETLTAQGYQVVTTREPGGTKEAEKVRGLLVQRDGGDWTPMAECLLLYAARVMHVDKIIKPALEDGAIVISDRFFDSTLAYQGYGHGLDRTRIEDIQKASIGNFAPNLTLILDVDPEIGLERSGRRLASEELGVNQTEDRYENLEIEFHTRLRDGFLEIAAQNKSRCHVIDATMSEADIASSIAALVLEKLPKRGS